MSLFKEKKSFFGRLSERISDVLMARTEVDEDLMDELEEALIMSDIGMETTMNIMDRLRDRVKNEYIISHEEVRSVLKDIMIEMADKKERQEIFKDTPLIILVIGVNG